eukprot:Seg4824.6 transcript_id=Seg4824.6/GoldUCD/mRNA.D3Y31 product="hypothetical protein" protein_id=Seg4824.6/GoldUCD/D3Y31
MARGRGKATKRKYAEDDISNASTLKKRKVNDAMQTRRRFTSKVNTDEKATTGEEGHNQHKPKYKATKRKYAEDNIIDGLSFMKSKVNEAVQQKHTVDVMKYQDIFQDEDISQEEFKLQKGTRDARMFSSTDVVIHEYNLPLKRIHPALYHMEQMKETVLVIQTVLRRLLIGLPNHYNNC